MLNKKGNSNTCERIKPGRGLWTGSEMIASIAFWRRNENPDSKGNLRDYANAAQDSKTPVSGSFF